MKYWKNTILLLNITFICMIIFGSILIYNSNIILPKQSTLETNVKTNEVSIKIETAIPGIIVFTFGSIGLILMLIKIPIKEVLRYKSPEFQDSMTFKYGVENNFEPIYSDVKRVPLLMWLFYYKKHKSIKVEY